MGAIAPLYTGFRGGAAITEAVAGPSGVGGSAQAIIPAGGIGTLTYILGWVLTWNGAGTGAVNDEVFVTAGGLTMRYEFTTVSGIGGSIGDTYPTAIPATTANTAITVGVSAVGNRGNVDIVAHGYSRLLP